MRVNLCRLAFAIEIARNESPHVYTVNAMNSGRSQKNAQGKEYKMYLIWKAVQYMTEGSICTSQHGIIMYGHTERQGIK